MVPSSIATGATGELGVNNVTVPELDQSHHAPIDPHLMVVCIATTIC